MCIRDRSRTNLAYAEERGTFDEDLGATDRLMLADAQTSGGLLLAVPPDRLDALVDDLRARGTPAAAVVGRFAAGAPGRLRVRRSRPA